MTRKLFGMSETYYEKSSPGVFINRDILEATKGLLDGVCDEVVFVVGEHSYNTIEDILIYESEKQTELFLVGYSADKPNVSLYSDYKIRVLFADFKVVVTWDRQLGSMPQEVSTLFDLVSKQPRCDNSKLEVLSSAVSNLPLLATVGAIVYLSQGKVPPNWLWFILGAAIFFDIMFDIRYHVNEKSISLNKGNSISSYFKRNSSQLFLLFFGAAMGGFFAALFSALFKTGS
ncbi:hypothetical protein DU971_23495 [Vibrio parahaemolyticus]|nr:hypothetical protein [Vibrio parahaemolyticus]